MASSLQSNGPLHVLMALPPTEQRQCEFNPRIQRDYITRRTKAYGIASNPSNAWTGVSKTEHALIRCCEMPEEQLLKEEIELVTLGTPNAPLIGGGVLDIEQEVRFVGILASSCHDLGTRALALAILERTLEAHLTESDARNRRFGTNVENDSEHQGRPKEEEEQSDEELEDDDEGNQSGQKRRSQRLRKQEPKYKRTKRKDEEHDSTTKQDGKMFDHGKWSRLEQFFAAGGLRILNRWLLEASKDEFVAVKNSKPLQGNKNKSSDSIGLKVQASSTRPLILPILRFLEHIPFDKKLVLDSKINKQIRRIEKQIDGIIESRSQGKQNSEDLKGWTTANSTSKAESLNVIKEAVEHVKKSWGASSKKEKQTLSNPFAVITETLRERMETLVDFDRGVGPRPEWLAEETKKESVPKKSRSELAAKERQAEAEIRKHLDQDLQNKLREAEKRHREHLAKLREKRNMMLQIASEPTDLQKKSNGRRVQWKDGMKTKSVRNRKMLEEVYVFDKQTPANKDLALIPEGDDRDSAAEPVDSSAGVLEVEYSSNASVGPETIDLTLD